MLITVWKSEDEIRHTLVGAHNIAVFSCNVCANLNGTGGPGGLRQIKKN